MKLLPFAVTVFFALNSYILGSNGHPVLASICGYLAVALLVLTVHHIACQSQKKRRLAGYKDVSGLHLVCAGCDEHITRLPSIPDRSSPVYCADCDLEVRYGTMSGRLHSDPTFNMKESPRYRN